jgi:transcriptional regulator with XRE-family HTH domain
MEHMLDPIQEVVLVVEEDDTKYKKRMSIIGIKIRKLRIANNLSQPELSDILGISQPTLCNIESGERKKIDFSLIQKICIVFNKELNYFTEASSLEIEPNIKTIDNNEVITGAILNLVDNFKLLIEDNKHKSKIIEVLENKLKSDK